MDNISGKQRQVAYTVETTSVKIEQAIFFLPVHSLFSTALACFPHGTLLLAPHVAGAIASITHGNSCQDCKASAVT